jgi:NADH dehydrogenase
MSAIMSLERKTQIIILGGGFGGMYTALELEKILARNADIEVTLVNRENFFLFTPMLHEVAASDLDLSHIVNPVRKLLRRVTFFDGDVVSIDPTKKEVMVSHGTEAHVHTLEYDHLVLGLGSITNFNNLPGLERKALTMKSLGDAIYLRNRLIENLETADFECNAELREPLLTFVVAGGGFAGVETVAAVNDFVREALKFYPNLKEEMLRVVLVHSGSVVLPELGEKLGAYAQKVLAKRGVEILTKVRMKSYVNGVVELNDGTTMKSSTVVWTAGTAPNPILSDLPFKKEKGRVVANEFMEVPDWEGVWAVGDCAVIPDVKTGKPFPPTAQHAIREGRTLARNIIAAIRGEKKKPFVFSTIGLLASIGRRTGVAQILGYNFSGFIAWWLWRTIYLSKLPRFEKKFRVALDWTLDILFAKDIVQFQTLRSPSVSHTEGGQAAVAQGDAPSTVLPLATGTWRSHVPTE